MCLYQLVAIVLSKFYYESGMMKCLRADELIKQITSCSGIRLSAER